jgi:hypothetical protein
LEIGGAGGPAGGTGGSDGGGGVVIVSTGAGAAYDIAAESPLEPAAADTEGEGDDPVGGAGVTGGTGSARSADVSPLSLAGSVLADSDLADSDLPSPPGLSPSGLAGSLLAASLFGMSPVPGASLAVSALGSSLGFPRRLNRCLADNLRPSGPRSGTACGGTWLSTSTREA